MVIDINIEKRKRIMYCSLVLVYTCKYHSATNLSVNLKFYKNHMYLNTVLKEFRIYPLFS